MLKLLSVLKDMYAVQDTSDGSIEILNNEEICFLLNLGVSVGGATRVSDIEFSCDDSVSTVTEDDIAEDEDYYGEDDDFSEDYEYDDEEPEESDESYEEYDEYSDYDEDEDLSYDDGYEDEESMLEESVVNKLYGLLTEEQLTALRRYYLWYSRRLFSEAAHDPTFGIADVNRMLAKKKALDQLKSRQRSDSKERIWKYAGFIDMGMKGNGFCELGHPLRYMHIAWDVSVKDIDRAFFGEDYDGSFDEAIESDDSIIFGIKCIADFFEVDKSVVAALQAAQRESLKDMAILYEYYSRGMQDSIMSEFKVLDDFMSKYKVAWVKSRFSGRTNELTVDQALVEFYMEFRKVNLVPPKSMVQLIRDKLVGWNIHKFTGELKEPNLSVVKSNLRVVYTSSIDVLFDRASSRINRFNLSLYQFIHLLMVYKITGAYEWGTTLLRDGTSDVWKDEGGWSAKVRGAYDSLTYNFKLNMFKDPVFDFDYMLKLVDVINLYDEIKEFTSNISYPVKCINYSTGFQDIETRKTADLYFLRDSLQNYSNEFCNDFSEKALRLLYLSENTITSAFNGAEYARREKVTIDEALDNWGAALSVCKSEIPKFIEYMTNILKREADEYNTERQRLLDEQARKEEEERIAREESEKKDKEVEEKLTKEDEEKEKREILDFVKSADVSSLESNPKFSFALTVLGTVKRYGKDPSDRQFPYIKDIYDALHGKEVNTDHRKPRVSLADRPELKEAIDWVLKNGKDLLDSKTYDICCSVSKYKTISEAQMKYILAAKEVYDKSK